MTALDQNFSDLASILMQRRQQQNQQSQQDRANRLSDLQFTALQDEQNYKTGLRGAMANPQTMRQTSIAPQQAQAPQLSLASLGNQMQPQQFQPTPQAPASPIVQAYNEGRVSTETTTQTPEQAAIDYARKNNRPDDVTKYINLNQQMMAQVAQAKMYGGEEQAAQMQAEMDKMTKASALLSSWKKAGGLTYAKQMAAQNPQMFDGDDMSTLTDSAGVNKYELPNGQFVVWSDDNPGQLHMSAAPKTEAASKPFSREYEEGDTKTTELYDAKGNLTGTKKAPRYKPTTGGGSSMPTAKPPTGYRYKANGDLEPVPGGPADQKVTQAVKSQEGAVQAINTAITTVQELIDHPGRASATGGTSLTNALAAPGGDAKTFLHKLETFKSQMFVPMVQQMKGMGQLSDAEGRKLTAAVGALEPSMSESEFKRSLTTIMTELRTTRDRTSTPISGAATGRSGVPAKPQGKPAPKLSKAAQAYLNKRGE